VPSAKAVQPVPADLVRRARDLIEEANRAVLDDGASLTAPRIHDTARTLMSLVERLPQALDQLATFVEWRAEQGAIVMDTGQDPAEAAAGVAEDLRVAGAAAQQLAGRLAEPVHVLSAMGHQG
jgi:hypothetical protein